MAETAQGAPRANEARPLFPSCLLFPLLLTLAAGAVAAPPADHIRDEQGKMHAMDLKLPYSSHCTDCHATDLLGGLGPSCYSCHPMYWFDYDKIFLAPPNDHTVVKGRGAAHKPGFGDPFTNGCIACHGPNLDDGFAPSCFTCHGTMWAGSGPPDDHTELKGEGGFAAHKPGFGDPIANGCTQCHGPNLNDGFATSCFSCHGAQWAGGGPPENHTELKLGFAAHKPGFWEPITNNCTQCHGPNLDDGFATACSDCHGPVWDGTDGHHMPGRTDPWNSCTTCHGAQLQGDSFGDVNTPACDSCHNDFSSPDPPPPGHNNVYGTMDHTNMGIDDRLTPLAPGRCAACHGPELAGGFAQVSCFACHDQMWSGDPTNSPPVVDPGGNPTGQYSGNVGVPIDFDASGTNDPDDDALAYEWDFGDGSTPTSSGDPMASHTYTQAGTYNAQLTVTDNVNTPVTVAVTVEVSDDGNPPPGADRWTITTTTEPPETYGITFIDHFGSLVGLKDGGGIALGIEFPGVIFWVDFWFDSSGSSLWGAGDMYFGNIDRPAGTMAGVLFDDAGGVFTFAGTKP